MTVGVIFQCGAPVRGDEPQEIARILRSARTDPHGADLQKVLRSFENRWRYFALRRWPWLQEHHDDVINAALQRICDRIDELEDDSRVEYWATLQFIRVMDGVRKTYKKEMLRKADRPPDDQDGGDPFDQFPSAGLSPEAEAAFRERLRIVQSIVQLSREAWLRLREDLPVEDVARITGKGPAYVTTLTKRLRRALKEYLDGNDKGGARRSPKEIFGKSGLPKDLVDKILELLRNMNVEVEPGDDGSSGRSTDRRKRLPRNPS